LLIWILWLCCLQALEAVKLLSGVGDPLSRRLLVVDCAAGRFHLVKLRAK
jgi:adenylyltransferase/sulfurtransferase